MDFGIDLSPVDLTYICEIQIQKISVGKRSRFRLDGNTQQVIIVFSFDHFSRNAAPCGGIVMISQQQLVAGDRLQSRPIAGRRAPEEKNRQQQCAQ